jgi:hypothetical protein
MEYLLYYSSKSSIDHLVLKNGHIGCKNAGWSKNLGDVYIKVQCTITFMAKCNYIFTKVFFIEKT